LIADVRQQLEAGATELAVKIGDHEIMTLLEVSARQRQHLLAGGTLNFVKQAIKG
jgi:aconitate hydratase